MQTSLPVWAERLDTRLNFQRIVDIAVYILAVEYNYNHRLSNTDRDAQESISRSYKGS